MNWLSRLKEEEYIHKLQSTLLGVSLILTILSLSSRFVGLFRARLITEILPSQVQESYNAAFTIPDLIYNFLILGTLSAAFIPIFSQLIHTDNSYHQAQKLIDDVFTLVALVMGGLSVLLLLGAPLIMPLFAPGFEQERLDNAVILMRVMAFSPLIFSLSSIVSGVLHTYKRFIVVALAPILYNVGIIIGLVWLYPQFGVLGLGYGVVLGAIIHFLIKLPIMLKETPFRLRLATGIDWENLKPLWALYWPRIIILDLGLVSLFFGVIIASLEDTGVSILRYSFDLSQIPMGVFALSFIISVYPYLSQSFAEHDEARFASHIRITTSRILFLLIPIMVLMLNYRAQLVRIVYGGAEVGWEMTEMMIATFTLFALSIPFQGLVPLFSRTLLARHDSYTPMYVGGGGVLVNVILSVIFFQLWGVPGIAAAFSVTMMGVCAVYARVIFRRVQAGTIRSVVWYSLYIALISYAVVGIAFLGKSFLGEVFDFLPTTISLMIQVVLSSIPAVIVYGLFTWQLGLMNEVWIFSKDKQP